MSELQYVCIGHIEGGVLLACKPTTESSRVCVRPHLCWFEM